VGWLFDVFQNNNQFQVFEKMKIMILGIGTNSEFVCLLFTILHPFGTRESMRRKANHGRQIVLWYWQHVTNLAKVTVFIVCMNLTRVLVWVRGKAEQKRSLTFCVFGQTRNKCSSSSTFLKSQPRQSLSGYGMPFHAPNTTLSCVLPHRN